MNHKKKSNHNINQRTFINNNDYNLIFMLLSFDLKLNFFFVNLKFKLLYT
jgi:hypothetical protein